MVAANDLRAGCSAAFTMARPRDNHHHHHANDEEGDEEEILVGEPPPLRASLCRCPPP